MEFGTLSGNLIASDIPEIVRIICNDLLQCRVGIIIEYALREQAGIRGQKEA